MEVTPVMTKKQLKAINRRKSIQRKRNIRTNNIPRTMSGAWLKRFADEYGIQ